MGIIVIGEKQLHVFKSVLKISPEHNARIESEACCYGLRNYSL